MNNFNDRERGFEAKYSFDLEQDFRIEAHLYKMLAVWAGEQMGMAPADCDAYAKKVIGEVIANPKENSIVTFLLADFGRNNIDVTVSTLQAKLEQLRPIARAEMLAG
ncbi:MULTISPECIES: DUF1476 domain-containing protein [Thalassospira]|jgi:hypothetical protein|uniref:DUF1476 domain-containing protein n=2 Tax=Thalassospira TaxID=168934 RepID=A0A358HU47_9PROT|nr:MULTISPECIES: DUF1476 domain-containing protein [Thalassospira]PKR60372.1 DUF1476 domain-containing protein [Thalassospira lohafexi]RCK23403.1 hypothetical protein TH1_16185 [Thalassospira lucentensis MCCC 1A00383 = DSM 14000]HBU98698.1 DUF1476 domain-containing protein [Thalassospira lucentensis]HCW68872.1 DUF1476 domain-containing protein [Thalassospira lucentensis]|tara:strand:+ start:78570 stop:78890 length:321 start_codon:yes stop_codon:yes gene_type:complete